MNEPDNVLLFFAGLVRSFREWDYRNSIWQHSSTKEIGSLKQW
jgi:hypothetical protein